MVDSFQPKVGQRDFCALGQLTEDRRVEVAGGIEWHPPWPDNVTRMQQGRGKAIAPRFVQQVTFNRRFLDAVVTERAARGSFGGRHGDAGAVNPDRAAMQKVLHLAAQGLDQLLRTGQGKTDHVDHNVGIQCPNLLAKAAIRFGRAAVNRHLLYRLPRAVTLVGFALTAANINHRVPGGDQARHQIRSHMATATNNNGTSHSLLLIIC